MRTIQVAWERGRNITRTLQGRDLAQFVSLSPAGHAAGPAWSRPRDMHCTGLCSPLGFTRLGPGHGPCPEGLSQLWIP
jgi:hypothetical protein